MHNPAPGPTSAHHLRFAYELIDEEGGLSRRVMRTLSGHPRRYAELEHLHGAGGVGALTAALGRLEADGLVDKRTSRRHVAVFHTFELTAMGARAEAEMQKLRPVPDLPEPPMRRKPVNRRAPSRPRPGWQLSRK